MSFNKTLIVLTAALSVSLSAVAADIKETSTDLKQLMQTVPERELDREAELSKLQHLNRRFSELADIAESQAKMRDAEAPAKTPKHMPSFVEQQIQAAMMADRRTGSPTSPAPDSSQVKPKKQEEFAMGIDLLSLWGDPKNPTADVSINGRSGSTELKKGSFIDGWRVTEIGSGYMEVKQGNKINRVYFMNSTGQNL